MNRPSPSSTATRSCDFSTNAEARLFLPQPPGANPGRHGGWSCRRRRQMSGNIRHDQDRKAGTISMVQSRPFQKRGRGCLSSENPGLFAKEDDEIAQGQEHGEDLDKELGGASRLLRPLVLSRVCFGEYFDIVAIPISVRRRCGWWVHDHNIPSPGDGPEMLYSSRRYAGPV